MHFTRPVTYRDDEPEWQIIDDRLSDRPVILTSVPSVSSPTSPVATGTGCTFGPLGRALISVTSTSTSSPGSTYRRVYPSHEPVAVMQIPNVGSADIDAVGAILNREALIEGA
jgi:hypothetical protein